MDEAHQKSKEFRFKLLNNRMDLTTTSLKMNLFDGTWDVEV